MDQVHIYMNEGGGVTAEYCIPTHEAQLYIEKFEADGCFCEGAAACPGESCELRHNDPGEPFLEDLAGTGWRLALPPLKETESAPEPGNAAAQRIKISTTEE